jgi:hypothetical protein
MAQTHLVAWQDSRSAASWDVYAARVSPAGVLLDPSGLAIAPWDGQEQAPALAFDGTNYLAAFEDFRSGQWIYGTRVSPAGAVLDPSGILISAVCLRRPLHRLLLRLHHPRRPHHRGCAARCRG